MIETKEGIRDFIAGMLELVMVIMERRKEAFEKLISGRRLVLARA